MTDEEIKTKRLSDWKPETDIRLQKAFGKFVEEAGELLEAIDVYQMSYDDTSDLEAICDLENELADCDAVVTMIQMAATPILDFHADLERISFVTAAKMQDSTENILFDLVKRIGKTLSIIGRCQIQGLNGNQPESGVPNRFILAEQLAVLRAMIRFVIKSQSFNSDRIAQRKQAKIDSKLPWVMGTATDLLPDIQTP